MKIKKITEGPRVMTLDIEVGDTHSYQLSNGVVTHNTASLVLGSSSGIHAWHDEYYIRRVRIGKNEALYRYLLQMVPSLVEDCHFKPHLEAILSVPQKAPPGAILRHESAIELLDRVLHVNQNWILAGHQRGVQPHNVSCTISVKPAEWIPVIEWMWENREKYNGIALFPFKDHTYIQSPFESCTKEKYEELFALLQTINLNDVIEMTDNTSHGAEAACAGNGCEL
jgi:ribonucleoside-diphosphate reductase alpha chain